MMNLTEEQEAGLDLITSCYDNIAVNALAGTGKTFFLVQACQRIPADDTILALAFNKNIADELQERLPANAEAKTLNSLGHGAVARLVGKKLYLNNYKIGGILRRYANENAELWSHWSGIVDIVRSARMDGVVPAGCISYNAAKPLIEDTDAYWLDKVSDHSQDVPADPEFYRQILRDSIQMAFDGEIDFDDQIYMTVVFPARVKRYDYVLIDEIQDLSIIQHSFIDKMVDDSTRVIMAGDRFQAIYAWRGASCNSMDELIKKYDCRMTPLTVSFRCSNRVIKEAQKYVPSIKALGTAEEGSVSRLEDWDQDSIAEGGVILCRNVAPLVRTTYKFIANGRPATMLGRDIGKGLQNLIRTICKPADTLKSGTFLQALADWEENEIQIARSKGQNYREDSVRDKAESIRSIQQYSRALNTDDLIKEIDKLFSSKARNKVILSTIHKSKGLEWPTVYLMDKWRIPSKHVKNMVRNKVQGANELMQQETNLLYVAITRAQKDLVYIESDKFQDEDTGGETDQLLQKVI